MATEFLHDVQVPQLSPTSIHCDNQDALYISSIPVFHECIKRIELDCHFVRDEFQANRISQPYIPSEIQPTDLFTKALGSSQFHSLMGKLGICNLHSPT